MPSWRPLEDAAPENILLSHDLFEGLHARVALVSDVEFVDEYPSSVLAHSRRQHRWIRGDWQILAWLFPFVPSRHGVKRNRLPMIGRWKILDNLRRSLVSPMLLLMLVAAWTVLPGPLWYWITAVLTVIASQLLPLLGRLLVGPQRSQSFPVFWRNLREDAATAVAQVVLGTTFLAYNAWETVHAIALTIVRMAVTGRRLLEWETAAAVDARSSGLAGPRGVRRVVNEMMASPIIAVGVVLLVAIVRPGSLPAATPLILLWLAAPGVAYWLSLPVGLRQRPLSDAERSLLRRTARNTWRFFETFVTAETSWLPPDNYQESETEPQLALRTSPTNVAMSLLSTLAAHDLGYLSTAALLERLDRTLTTLEGLERHEGHFLNWYDTTTLAPLRPHYVSTVDSGNLAGGLIALAQGLLQLTGKPQTEAQRLDGVIDTAEVLATIVPAHDGGDRTRTPAAHVALARQIAAAAREAIQTGALDTTDRARPAAERHGGGQSAANRGPEQRSSTSGFARWQRRLPACASPPGPRSRTRPRCTRWRPARR